MTEPFFAFGRRMPEYAVPVLNERAVRAGAGILFFLAMVSFMNAWLLGNFAPTRVFVVAFLIDFGIRLFVNPRFAPSLVLGQWMVRKQQPEWTGAPQKRFAWAIGFALALTMLYLIVFKGVVGPINMLVCGACLLLLFFESAFGICIGCWIYNQFKPEQAQLCPGGACEYTPDPKERITLTGYQITDWDFEGKTLEQIAAKRQATMAIITAKANAERARQDAITAEEQGKANVVTAQYEKEVEKERAIVAAQQAKEVATIAAEQQVAVAMQQRIEAEQKKLAAVEYKQEQTLRGEGDAAYKRLVMQADGALAQKLATYEAVMGKFATEFGKQKWVPEIAMGAASGAQVGQAAQFIELLTVKAAKDLQLNLKPE